METHIYLYPPSLGALTCVCAVFSPGMLEIMFFLSLPLCVCGPAPCVCMCRKMIGVCGEAESKLASELMHHEVQIVKDILDPLNLLAEVGID